MKVFEYCSYHFWEVVSGMIGAGVLILRALSSRRNLNKIEDKLDKVLDEMRKKK